MTILNDIKNVGIGHNNGEKAEYNFAYAMGIKSHKKDSVAYDVASDVEVRGIGYSVKSKGATLTEKLVATEKTETAKLEIINEYIAKVHSKYVAYVVDDRAYIMDMVEFKKMLVSLWSLDEGTRNNKGKYKLRIKKANSTVIKWIESNF